MATHQLKLDPFPVIKTVTLQMPHRRREEGMLQMPGLPLSEISIDTLSEMCDDFKVAMLMERENQVSVLGPARSTGWARTPPNATRQEDPSTRIR